jgi:hypothetical protein
LEALNPQPPSPQAAEGEIAHALASDFFKGGSDPLKRIGEATPRGPVTEDHARGAAEFIAAVRARWDGVAPLCSEAWVRIEDLGLRGKVDLFWIQDRALWIWDYKHGMTWVPAVENWQLLVYAVALVSSPAPAGARPEVDFDRVHLCICQPRAFDPEGPVKVWTVSVDDVWRYSARITSAVLAAAHTENPPSTPGSHCLWCSGRGVCPALGRAASAVWGYVSGSTYCPPGMEALGAEIDILKVAADLIKARISGLEADALARMNRGEVLPGWDRVQKFGNLDWTVPIDQAAEIVDLSGIDIRKKSLLTPLQAIAAGVPREIVEVMAARPPRGFELKKSKLSAEVVFNG